MRRNITISFRKDKYFNYFTKIDIHFCHSVQYTNICIYIRIFVLIHPVDYTILKIVCETSRHVSKVQRRDVKLMHK